MRTYRECARNLWNVYFSQKDDSGSALDAFEQIRELLFDSLVLGELSNDGEAAPALTVMPRPSSIILIDSLGIPGRGKRWVHEKDMVVGPDDIKLAFLDYYDFSEVPIKDFYYFRCKILSFSNHPEYEGREALLEAVDARVFHDEEVNLAATS